MREAVDTLCAELLRVPAMTRRSDRDVLVAELARRMPIGPLDRADDAPSDLAATLGACLRRPGGLRELVQVVTDLHPGEAAERLARTVDFLLPDELLTFTERTELAALLRTVDTAMTAPAFRRTLPLDPLLPGDGGPDDLVARLEPLSGGDGQPPPLLGFVWRLARQVFPDPRAARLSSWAETVAGRLGVPARVPDEPAAPAPAGTDRLTVVVRPDVMADGRYLLSVWLQHGGEPERALAVDDEPRPVGDLSVRVRQAVEAADRQSRTPLLIEIVLPRALLTEPVDQWPAGPDDRPLGRTHEVVLRSLDRLRLPQLGGRSWRRLWHRLTDGGGPTAPSAVRVSPPAGPRVWRPSPADEPVVLVLDTPLPAASELRDDAFTAALAAGVPAMVWCREPALGRSLVDVVRGTVETRGAGRVRTAVGELRGGSGQLPPVGGATADRLGRSVALLWDDADRLPPEFRAPQFRAPQ